MAIDLTYDTVGPCLAEIYALRIKASPEAISFYLGSQISVSPSYHSRFHKSYKNPVLGFVFIVFCDNGALCIWISTDNHFWK